MGYKIIDSYSYLHFAVGGLWRALGLNFWLGVVLHIIFEYTENTKTGMKFINNNFTLWPGGKPKADTLTNSISDIIFSVLGWLFQNRLMNTKISKTAIIFYLGSILAYWFKNKNKYIIFLLILLLLVVRNLHMILVGIIGYIVGYIINIYGINEYS